MRNSESINFKILMLYDIDQNWGITETGLFQSWVRVGVYVY